MAVRALVQTSSGRSLFVTLQQVTTSGTLGDVWNNTTGAWAASVPINDAKILLTEGGVNYSGSYSGGRSGAIGTYTGLVLKRVHDSNQGNLVVGAVEVKFVSGDEVTPIGSGDVANIPADVRTYLNSNPVPASNMRGTDNALLAASYVAPDNAGITTASAKATSAELYAIAAASNSGTAVTAASSVDGKLTTARAAKLDNIDVVLSTRSTLTAAQVRTELNSNPVPASNMRGTDNALLAASYTAPSNATIATAAADALAAKTAAETTVARLTATRAGYLDNLSAGPVATAAGVSAITNSTSIKLVAATEALIPASGSTAYTVDLFLYGPGGAMEAPDATPTFTAENAAGTSRNANLGSVTLIGTGQYRTTYTVSSAHAAEQIIIKANAVEGGAPRVATHVMPVLAITASDFTSTDRTKLQAIYDKLPTKPYLVGTAASDGDIDLAQCDGSRDPFKADVSALATTAAVAAIPADVRTYLNANPVPASNMRGTDNALLAASYTAPNNVSIAAAAADALAAKNNSATAATLAGNAATSSASVDTKLTPSRAAALDQLDASVSSRAAASTLAAGVTLASGHGLATASQATAIQAKTDLIPAQPAAISNIPTASQVAAQVDATLTASHPGNWAAGGDATSAKQDQILAAVSAINPAPPSSVVSVSAQRTFSLRSEGDESVSPNIVTVPSGATVVLAMDFTALLNAGTAITAVGAVTDLSGNGLVPTSLAVSQDRRRAHFTVASLTTGKRYDLRVSVSTSDGQTLTGRGILHCN